MNHLHILYNVYSMLGVIFEHEPLTIKHTACHSKDILLYFTGNSSQLELVDTALFSLSVDDHRTDDLVVFHVRCNHLWGRKKLW